MRVCAEPGCPVISAKPRCPPHTRARDRARGTPAQRGYDTAHKRERARWQPLVDAGKATCHEVICLEPTRRIAARAPFDLAHTPDRTTWLGPAHPRCNRAAGGRAAHP